MVLRSSHYGHLGRGWAEGARHLQRILKRAACWLDGDQRAVRQEELKRSFGLMVARQIWRLLDAKNLIC